MKSYVLVYLVDGKKFLGLLWCCLFYECGVILGSVLESGSCVVWKWIVYFLVYLLMYFYFDWSLLVCFVYWGDLG